VYIRHCCRGPCGQKTLTSDRRWTDLYHYVYYTCTKVEARFTNFRSIARERWAGWRRVWGVGAIIWRIKPVGVYECAAMFPELIPIRHKRLGSAAFPVNEYFLGSHKERNVLKVLDAGRRQWRCNLRGQSGFYVRTTATTARLASTE
jgi:hypothetical protein